VSTEAKIWENWLHLFLNPVYTLSPVKKTGALVASENSRERPSLGGSWFGLFTLSTFPIATRSPSNEGFLFMFIALGKSGLSVEIDDADAELVSVYRWMVIRQTIKYATTTTRSHFGKKILMHRFLCGLAHGDPREVDHIDGNGLNNKRTNLRICTRYENARNRKKNKNNSIGFKGVEKRKDRNMQKPYRGSVYFLGKKYRSKYFSTAEEAHTAYCEIAKMLQGEFARFE
tara:strand:- start:520 stop:1209 length:690 start_codon:yes stop_codon:yes gene_type:complete